jgi:hypothetical protein
MPKFEKGYIEMKNHMADLRAKRGTKKTNEHIQKYLKSISRI